MIIFENDFNKILAAVDFSNLVNKKVLITGASGLLGVYLVLCLSKIKTEYNIKIHVNFQSEIEPYLKYIFEHVDKIYKSDISIIENIKQFEDYDIIIHASGYAQPGKFLANKLKTISINTTSTIALLKKLKADGKFLFISSSEVYNGLEKLNIKETEIGITNTDNPRASYIESKRCGEAICYSFDTHKVKIARLSLAYGPGTRKFDNRVMSSLIEKGIFDKEINLMDNGESFRTYCYISDVIEMLFNILLNGKEIVYNVGGISQIKIIEMAKLIGNYFNKQIKIPEDTKSLIGSPKIVNVSIERYKNEFNKHEFVSFEDGLRNTVEWQKFIYKL